MPARSRRRRESSGLHELRSLCRSRTPELLDIGARVDERGRFSADVDQAFPLEVNLYAYDRATFNPRANWHDTHEIVMPVDRSCWYVIGQMTVEVGPGDVLIMNNASPHVLARFEGARCHVLVLRFLPRLVESVGTPSVDRLLLLPFRCHPEGRPHLLKAQDPLADDVHCSIAAILAASGEPVSVFSEAALKVGFLNLLHRLSRRFWSPELERYAQRQAIRSERLDRVIASLRQNCGRKITSYQAARMASMSESAFNRAFKRATGMSFKLYLTQSRLLEAANLLVDRDDPISDIARSVGFADQSHLNRRFKEFYGTTPRVYRARGRGLLE